MNTTAQQIADMFDNNGARIWNDAGRSIIEVCCANRTAYQSEITSETKRRYVFDDNSAIVFLNGAWGIGFTEAEADEDERKRFVWPNTFAGD